MRNVLGWLSRNGRDGHDRVGNDRHGEPVAGRRRIDLGDEPPPYPIYAIGDVHGCFDLLRAAEQRIADDIAETGRAGLVILVGDYVDRGPMSSRVLDHLIAPSDLGLKRLPLCGNHDALFGLFLDRPELHGDWLELGGEQTLLSYGLDVQAPNAKRIFRSGGARELLAEAVPAAHRNFLATLPVSLKIGNLLFVHAGLRPGIVLDRQTDEDMMWVREPFLSEGPRIPHLVVIHGHTPSDQPSLGPQRIGIDTGAFYSGQLTILKVEGSKWLFL